MRPLDALHLASAERGGVAIGTPIEFVATRKKTNGES